MSNPTTRWRVLYDHIKGDYDLPEYEEFERKMNRPGEEGYRNRLSLWNHIKDDYDVGETYEEFKERIGLHSQRGMGKPVRDAGRRAATPVRDAGRRPAAPIKRVEDPQPRPAAPVTGYKAGSMLAGMEDVIAKGKNALTPADAVDQIMQESPVHKVVAEHRAKVDDPRAGIDPLDARNFASVEEQNKAIADFNASKAEEVGRANAGVEDLVEAADDVVSGLKDRGADTGRFKGVKEVYVGHAATGPIADGYEPAGVRKMYEAVNGRRFAEPWQAQVESDAAGELARIQAQGNIGADDKRRDEALSKAHGEASAEYGRQMDEIKEGSMWGAATGYMAAYHGDGMYDLERLGGRAFEADRDYYMSRGVMMSAEGMEDLPASVQLGMAEQAGRAAALQDLYEEAVRDGAPKSATGFLLAKTLDGMALWQMISAANRRTSGSRLQASALEDGMMRMEEKHPWLGVTGSVAGMGLDMMTMPLYGAAAQGAGKLFSAGVGRIAKARAMRYGERALTKGAQEFAARKAVSSAGARMGTHMAAGAANLGAYEGMHEATSQILHGGHFNPQTGENEGYSVGSVLGAVAHGAALGVATGAAGELMGNASDKMVRGISSTAGKMAARVGMYNAGRIAEGTIFAAEDLYKDISEGDWNKALRDEVQSVGMMFAFGWKDLLVNKPRGYFRDVMQRNGRVQGVKSRLRSWLDAPARVDLALSEDERQELKDHGYDIEELARVEESVERGLVKRDNNGGATADTPEMQRLKRDLGAEEAAVVDRLGELLSDRSVSESARAKIFYYATGKAMPMGRVTRVYTTGDDENGYTVQSVGEDVGVITSRKFRTAKGARLEQERIARQIELNDVQFGERQQDYEAAQDQLREAAEMVSDEWKRRAEDSGSVNYTGGSKGSAYDAETILAMHRAATDKRRNGEDLEEGEERLLDEVNRRFFELGDKYAASGSEGIRAKVEDEYGLDPRDAMGKDWRDRTDEEREVVVEYLDRLFDARKETEPEDGRIEVESVPLQGERARRDAESGLVGDKYGVGEIKVATNDGRKLWGLLTGLVVTEDNYADLGLRKSDIGKHEYYLEGEMRYATREELDRIVMEYTPEDSAEETEENGSEDLKDWENSVDLQGETVDNGDGGGSGGSDEGDGSADWITGKDNGGGMASDTTGSVEGYRERSDIRVYEEGLESERNEHSDSSERARRDAESERLLGIAEREGQYYGKKDIEKLGDKQPKLSGESKVYIDTENGKVYKVKDPYAKSPMKSGVEPEDAILEHHLHNKYFPETAYTFEGISDEVGDVRIVLSQDFVESAGRPTQEQIDAALAEKGLYPEGDYRYGNDEVTVTDVTGDNALLGADGKVYFIDPIIGVKKPIREVLGGGKSAQGGIMPQGIAAVGNVEIPQGDGTTRTFTLGKNEDGENVVVDDSGFLWGHDGNGENLQPYRPGANVGVWNDEQLAKLGTLQSAGEQPATGPTTTENVPNTVETAVNPTENAVAGAENVPNLQESVENVQQTTALQRLPKDEKGNPIFEQAESADHGWDALVEFSEGDKATAKEIADTMAEEKRKAFEKAQKLKPKGKTPTDILASKKANAAELARAQGEYEHWVKMAGVEQNRESAVRRQQEAEARQRALERAEAEKAEKAAREVINANLSEEEKDEYGKPLVLAKDGTTTFGIIDAETGLTEAPIRLSLGENTKDDEGKNHGYGLLHIEAGHGDQIRNAGYASVEEFVEEVAKNYTDIREGALIGENQTYLLEVSDDHNNTLFIQLSKDGAYWNVNSAGIFRKRYSRRKPKVYDRPALGDGKSTDTTEVNSSQTEGATAPAGNSSETSDGKVNTLSTDKQISEGESFAQLADDKGAGLEQASVQASVQAASAEVNSAPTEGQKEAGAGVEEAVRRLAGIFREAKTAHDSIDSSNIEGIDTAEAEIRKLLASLPDEDLIDIRGVWIEASRLAGLDSGEAWAMRIAMNQAVPQERVRRLLELRQKAADDAANGEQTPAGTEPSDRGAGASDDSTKDGGNAVSRSSAEGKSIKKEMQNGKILHLSDELSPDSDGYLTEAPTEPKGPDLVPTSDKISSDGKVNTLSTDEQISEGKSEAKVKQARQELEERIARRMAEAKKLQERRSAQEAKVKQLLEEKKNHEAKYIRRTLKLPKEWTEEQIVAYCMKELTTGQRQELIAKADHTKVGKALEDAHREALSELSYIPRPESEEQIRQSEEYALVMSAPEMHKVLFGSSEETLLQFAKDARGSRGAGVEDDSAAETIEAEHHPPTPLETIQSVVEAASAEVNTDPTPAQAEAGNYKKGHVTIGEFDITIENPAGSTRKGVDADGKEWQTTMANTYGYIKGTEGVDGDHIDVFLHENMDEWNGRKVYVVDQTRPDGSFDEHKVMLGFNDKDAAMSAYLANYDETWAQTHPGLRISETNLEDFDKWIKSSHRKTKPFADYSSVSKVTDNAPTEQSETAISGNGYKVESKPYTNKQGKTLDTYLVTFDRDFSKEELSALRAKAKALKGWYDRETRGWMLRSQEDAKAFAEDVVGKGEDEVADEAPLSMADMGGQAKGVEPAAPARMRSKWISEEDAAEFDSLRRSLRSHLGMDSPDIMREDSPEYGHKKSPSKNRQDLTTPPAKAEVASSSLKGNAKVRKITENLVSLNERFVRQTSHRGALSELASAILADGQGYSTIVKPNGDEVHIRISNHNANSEHFAERGHDEGNISIVIKSRRTPNTFRSHPEVELTEYVYTTEAIKSDGNLLSQVAESLRRMIGTGEYVDLSGKAIVNRSPEVDFVGEEVPAYGKPQPKQMDAEVLRMGTRMTYLMMKGGLRKFADYAEAMVEEVGDAIRPHLKSLYAAAQNMEEVGNSVVKRNIGRDAEANKEAYEVAKGMLELAGIVVHEVDSVEADAMMTGQHEGAQMSAAKRRALDTLNGGSAENSKEAGSGANAHQGSVTTFDSSAKIQQKLETIAEKYDKILNASEKTICGELSRALGLRNNGNHSNYGTFEAKNGAVMRIRISDHNAEVKNFDDAGHDNGISIVISRKKNEGMNDNGASHVVEYFYNGYRLAKADGHPLSEIARSMQQMLYSGEYTDTTGLAERQEVNGDDVRVLKTAAGQVYGWTVGGEIYLNRDAMNPEAPFHEYTHLWDMMVQRENPELWSRGKELMKELPLWEEVKNDPNYSDIRNDEDAIASEVHSRMTGKRGAELLDEMRREAHDRGFVEEAEAVSIIHRIRLWLGEMFAGLKKTLEKWTKRDLRGLAAEKFADMTLRDLAEGNNPNHGAQQLVTLHNISESKLRKALNAGGLANPSMAVVKAGSNRHDGYGSITLVAPGLMSDKRKGRNAGTWAGDAWTPTYPPVERNQSYVDRAAVVAAIAESVPEEMRSLVMRGWDSHMSGGSENSLSYWFLSERGEAPEIARRRRRFDKELANKVLGLIDERPVTSLTDSEAKSLREIYIDEVMEGDAKKYSEFMILSAQSARKRLDETAGLMRMKAEVSLDMIERLGLLPSIRGWVNDIRSDEVQGEKMDEYATSSEANRIIGDEGLSGEFERWVEELDKRFGVTERLFAGYTPSGTRRYLANTAENASRIMKAQGRNGATGMSTGFSVFAASVLAPMKSHDEMRKASDRLRSENGSTEEFDKKWRDVYYDLAEKCQPDAERISDDYGFYRLNEAALQNDPARFLKQEYGVELNSEDVQSLKDMVEAIRKERPVKYFETKFERPVGLEEFAAAVVPENIDAELESAIKAAGLRIERYSPDKNGDRQRAVARAANQKGIRFHAAMSRRAEMKLAEYEELTKKEKEAKEAKYADMDKDVEAATDPRFRDRSEADRLAEIEALHPIAVERNNLSKAELQEVYRNLPVVEKDGREVEFYHSAFRKIYKEGGIFGQVVPVLDKVLEQSVLAYSEPDSLGGTVRPDGTVHKAHKNVESFDNYIGMVDIGGHNYYVRTTVQRSIAESGTHSFFVSDVDIYKKPAESRTIPITSRGTTDYSGIVDAKLQQFFERASSELRQREAEQHRELMVQPSTEAKRGHAEGMAKKFNTPIRIVEDTNELTHEDPEMQKRMRGSKGFYNPATDEVVVVVPNNATVEDIAETVFHEVVAHKGLREIIGEENYDAFCDEVYDHLEDDLKQQIDEETTRRFMGEPGKGYEHHRREAVDEMFGRMSEKGFEDFTKAERGIWAKLKAKVMEAINKFLGSLKLPKWVKLGDNELRYMLWKSHERLRTKDDYVDMARDVAKREELGLNHNKFSESIEERELREVNEKFNNQLDKLTELQVGDKTKGLSKELQLGKPGHVLKSAGITGDKIVLDWNLLNKKMSESYKHCHPFTVQDIKDLPLSINSPVAVFESRGHGDFNILVNLNKDGKKFVVSLEAKRKSIKGGEIVVDDIVTLYPKDAKGIIHWINTGLGKVYDKEKALEWLSDCETHNRHSAVQELEDAAKVIKNFENPRLETPKNEIRFRGGEREDTRYKENWRELPEIGNKARVLAVRELVNKASERVENPGTVRVIASRSDLEEALREASFDAHEINYYLSKADENGVVVAENGYEQRGGYIADSGIVLIFAHSRTTTREMFGAYLHEELHHAAEVNPLVRSAMEDVGAEIMRLFPEYGSEIRRVYLAGGHGEDVVSEECVANAINRWISNAGDKIDLTMLGEEVKPQLRKILTVIGYGNERTVESETESALEVWADRAGGGGSVGSHQAGLREDGSEGPQGIQRERLKAAYGETGDIWKDRSVGLEERITNAAIRLAGNQRADLTLRNDAQRAVVNNLQSLLRAMRNRRGTTTSFTGADRKVKAGVVDAMNAQAMYDRSTVKRVADLARILMQNGYLSGMTSGEMQRLLSAVKNATAMHDTTDYVQKIMDIMVGNQLRNAEDSLRKLLAIRGSKDDARGVEAQGELDVEGQRTMQALKEGMKYSAPELEGYTDAAGEYHEGLIEEAMNDMGSTNVVTADDAAIRYAGLSLALDYNHGIAESKKEEEALRKSIKTAKDDRDAGQMTDDAYNQFVETTQDAIRKNRIERCEAYFNLVGRLSDSLRGSIENAKAFREAEKARVNQIHHFANSDMEGRPANEHHKDDWKDKIVNNGFVQFLFAPLGTFDQIMRVFGNKSANGEGYLWSRFMRGWVNCRNKELEGVKDKLAQLDAKAAELFGKRQVFGKFKSYWVDRTWGDIIRMGGKLPKATVSFWDGGEMRDHELTQGNLMYIYMVDKMTDGRMKLRKMGITESDVAYIESVLDPRFKELADWLQDEFLVATREEYNETHKRMFGASMAAIENYFPLKILANARIDKEEDVNQQNRPDGITTKTGSIIKRRVNNLALDITGADALTVILDHITQMEHWNAYAEWNRDLNTLRTYKRFRNQVINMTTVYGGGRKLWEKFNDLCLMAAGEYRPPIANLDKSAVNIAKGVTAAKVSLRMFTALKQNLSAPAYAPEVSIRSIAKSIANPYGDFKWCMENMPIFRERWHSRISGDPRLLKSEMDWNMWRSRVMEICQRIGMTPNAFVDAVTVAIGARAIYETRLKQYLREGYPADAAEERAKQDAAILFNQTQQSSEAPFLSPIQVDRSWLSVLFTVFRNSSMSYTRQVYDSLRNLKRNLTPGQRAKSVEFMTKQILRDWHIDPDNATDNERGKAGDAAKKRFRRQIKKDIIRAGTFGFILELAWNIGSYLLYTIFGNDEDEKDKMRDDAITHTYFGSVEGLTGGDVMSAFGNMWLSGEWNANQLTKDMPLVSDINTIRDKFIGGKNAEAFTDIFNLVVQSGIGMNPQSITDTVVAIMDACGDDPALSHEAAILVWRVLQVPQSQIDKMYFDEIGLSGEEASKMSPEQLAQRYAEYKVMRGTPLAPWTWNDENRLDQYRKKAMGIIKEKAMDQGDRTVIAGYEKIAGHYGDVQKRLTEANKLKEEDYTAWAEAYAQVTLSPEYEGYEEWRKLNTELNRLTRAYLRSGDAVSAGEAMRQIQDYRAKIVRLMDGQHKDELYKELQRLKKENRVRSKERRKAKEEAMQVYR